MSCEQVQTQLNHSKEVKYGNSQSLLLLDAEEFKGKNVAQPFGRDCQDTAKAALVVHYFLNFVLRGPSVDSRGTADGLNILTAFFVSRKFLT